MVEFESMTADDRELFDRVARWEDTSANSGGAAVDELSRNHGIDFATALLYRRLSSQRARADDDTKAEVFSPRRHSDVVLGIVPGAFYRQSPQTGADGRRIVDVAERWGVAVERIMVPPFGSMRENGRQIADWVASRRGRRIVLVSLSKGAADVQAALADPNRDWRTVVGWIDLSGLLEGTAIVDWLLSRPFRRLGARALFWWHRLPFDVLPTLRRNPSVSYQIPRGMRVVHVIGVPLERHLSSRLARRAYRRLTPLGPNDGGGILLADAVGRPGSIEPLWGQDHYLRDVDVERLMRRLLASILVDPAVPTERSASGEDPVALACR